MSRLREVGGGQILHRHLPRCPHPRVRIPDFPDQGAGTDTKNLTAPAFNHP